MAGSPSSYKTDIRDITKKKKIVHVSCRAKCPLHLLARGEKLPLLWKIMRRLRISDFSFKQWAVNEDSRWNRSIKHILRATAFKICSSLFCCAFKIKPCLLVESQRGLWPWGGRLPEAASSQNPRVQTLGPEQNKYHSHYTLAGDLWRQIG